MGYKVRPPQERFWNNVDVKGSGDCWMWRASCNCDGYGFFSVHRKTIMAHRWSWQHHNGPIPDGLCVLHTCDTPSCVNPEHLWIGTVADNNADMVAKGRQARGEGNGAAELTRDMVVEIRASNEPLKVLAARYGVTMACVSYARRGDTWKHLHGSAGTLVGQAKGERAGGVKLTDSTVREIRASSGSRKSLALLYSVSTTAIRDVQVRETWRHVV